MKRGDVVLYQQRLVRILRKSRRTGVFTVELLEDYGPYKRLSVLHVMPYECKPAIQVRS